MRVLPRVSGSSGSCGAAPSHTHSHGTDVTDAVGKSDEQAAGPARTRKRTRQDLVRLQRPSPAALNTAINNI